MPERFLTVLGVTLVAAGIFSALVAYVAKVDGSLRAVVWMLGTQAVILIAVGLVVWWSDVEHRR